MRGRAACTTMLLWVLAAHGGDTRADTLTLSFSDPAGDAVANGAGGGDLVALELVFERGSSLYTATLRADPAAPFHGQFFLSIELFNRTLDGTPWRRIAALPIEFDLEEPQTELSVQRFSTALDAWDRGQLVAASSGDGAFMSTRLMPIIEPGTGGGGASGTQDPQDVVPADLFAADAIAQIGPVAPPDPPLRLKITFSGAFSSECSGASGACATAPLAGLLGTPFSGEVVFPNVGVDVAPDNPELGVYDFTTQAWMSIVTDDAAFSFSGIELVHAIVINCLGGTCAFNADFVSLSTTFGGHHFELALGAPRPPWGVDSLPTVAQFAALYANFSIATPDFSAILPAGDPRDGIDFDITTLPLEGVPATRTVPALPPPAVAALTLLLLVTARALGLRAARC
ncbi:MAG: hypothetical protein RLW61_08755 [Gammaproteobacteria bacterium]